MKKLIVTLCFLIVLLANQSAQFEVYYGNENGSCSGKALATSVSRDGYLIVGHQSIDGSSHPYLLKTDLMGRSQWMKYFITEDYSFYLRSITPVENSLNGLPDGYAITGGVRHPGTTSAYDVFFLRVTKDGEPLYSKVYGNERSDIGNVIIPVYEEGKNTGFVIGGNSRREFYEGDSYAYIIKTNEKGDLIRSIHVGNGNFHTCNGIASLSDGSYVFTGSSSQPCSDSSRRCADILVVKLKSNLSLQWSERIDITEADKVGDYGVSVGETRDHSIVLAGNTVELPRYYACWMKLDFSGRVLDFVKYRLPTVQDVTSMAITKGYKGQDVYALTGYLEDYTDYEDVYVLNLNEDGKLNWDRMYGSEGFEVAPRIIKDFKDGFSLTGYVQDFDITSGLNAFLMNLTADGKTNTQCEYEYFPEVSSGNVNIIKGPEFFDVKYCEKVKTKVEKTKVDEYTCTGMPITFPHRPFGTGMKAGETSDSPSTVTLKNGTIEIEISELAGNNILRIYTLSGILVHTVSLNQSGLNKADLNMLANGIYLATISDNHTSRSFRIVKE